MKMLFIMFGLLCALPTMLAADIPMPLRSTQAFLQADTLVLCSAFDELSETRVALFLENTSDIQPKVSVTQGPTEWLLPDEFSVLVVISGLETDAATIDCAKQSAPYGSLVVAEISQAIEQLGEPAKHPNKRIEHALGNVMWLQSLYYHEDFNLVTVVIGLTNASASSLNDTLLHLFDLPKTACLENPACFAAEK